MLHYPKIPAATPRSSGFCVAFEKLDGTNTHWDWDREFGWHAFGTRRDAFNLTGQGIEQFAAKHAHLSQAPPLFLETLADPLERLFRENPIYPWTEIKVFAEFLGPNSFAGLHRPEDPKRLVLFDVYSPDFGFVGPQRFLEDFGHLPSPRALYRGKYTGELVERVRRNEFGVDEGVIVKGGSGGGDVWMLKIKTLRYLERLKAAFADKWEDYWE